MTSHFWQANYAGYSAVVYREDAVRLGFFIGGFTGSYNLLSAILNRWQPDKPAQNCMAAGTAAGQQTLQIRTVILLHMFGSCGCWLLCFG